MNAAAESDMASVPRAPDRLPLQPLLDALPLDPAVASSDTPGPGLIAQAAALLPVTDRTLYRYRHKGLDPWTADRLAISAGLHPFTVWRDDWIRTMSIHESIEAGANDEPLLPHSCQR